MAKELLRLPRSILAIRLIRRILIFALLMMVLSLGVTALITWFHEERDMKRQVQDIEKSYQDIIRAALWVDDQENLRIITMGISRLPGIDSARIYPKGSPELDTHLKEAHRASNPVVPILHTYNGKTYELGELHLELDPNYVTRQIFKKLWLIGLSQFAVILAVCLLLFFLIYRLVIRRLVAVTAYAASLSSESLGNPLVMPKEKGQPDELNELTDAINLMQRDLHYAFKHQKSLEERLRKHKGALEETIAQRTSSLRNSNEQLHREIRERKKIEEEREKLIGELQKALAEVRQLSGLLPICSNCKKIRDDKGYWNLLESYISRHSEAVFTHSICPECVRKLYPDIDISDD
jgi:methyl-accepting chemotaxis protein